MLDSVITRVDQVTPAWLTAILRESGALSRGQVTSIEPDEGRGNWSSNARLLLTYSAEAEGTLPARLFLKMADTDLGDGESFDDSEVTYYTRDYRDVPDAPLLQCYHAAYSPDLMRYHLLLEDVSETHVMAREKEPELNYGLALAEGLGILHARWWGAEGLAAAGATRHSPVHIQRFVNFSASGAEQVLAHLVDELEPGWPELIGELFKQHPLAMIRRNADPEGFSIIHGDTGEGNILVPRADIRPIYLIDRQPFDWSLTVWLGAYDLAYAIVLDWPVATRRAWEIPILRQYHETLLAQGVKDYPWERLYDDYRLCVAMGVYIATEYFRGGINKPWQHVWLEMLHRSLTACEDLDCRSLWQGT